MATMPVVSFRLDEDDLDALESLGVNPGPRARELLLEELERHRFEESMSRLEEISRVPSKPVVELIREMREGRP